MSERPGRGGYVAAAVVLAVTAVAVVLLAASGLGDVRDAQITQVREGGTVRVGAEPVALWVRDDPDADVECRLGSPDGFVSLGRPSAQVTAGSWHRVAVAPDWVRHDAYELQCQDLPAGIVLGVGEDPPVGSLVLRFVGALAIGGVGVLLAIALIALTVWRRHRRPRPPVARMEST